MERFDALFEKNLPERGGSFYIQSKIYFAKQHLMMDFPDELNSSRFNPENAGREEVKAQESVAEEQKEDSKKTASDKTTMK